MHQRKQDRVFGQMEKTLVPVGEILQDIEVRYHVKGCADGLELGSTQGVFDDEEALALLANLLLFGHVFWSLEVVITG